MNPAEIAAAARILKDGGLVAFPTETVYGLGADATNDRAVAKIYAAKGRPQFNPLIAHVASAEDAFALGEFSSVAVTLAKKFWPGPLTLVVPRTNPSPVSLLASAGLPSLAIRVPSHPVAVALLHSVDRPIVAPSANLSGRISATTAGHVREGLGERVDMIMDGGQSTVGVESTIISFLEDQPRLLRAGGLPRAAIEAALGHAVEDSHSGTDIHSPGQLESHYAPRATLRLNATDAKDDEAMLGFGPVSGIYNLSPQGDLTEAAANLFAMLHQLDALNPKAIAVAPIPETGLGEAINDRLRRAAAPRPAA